MTVRNSKRVALASKLLDLTSALANALLRAALANKRRALRGHADRCWLGMEVARSRVAALKAELLVADEAAAAARKTWASAEDELLRDYAKVQPSLS